MLNIVVIPARGGSKRIPRKNIKNFAGMPIIKWPIDAAIASSLFDRIIVSTDDLEISSVAKQAGAEVPFLRPSHLADDHSSSVDVVRHAISEMENAGYEISTACCLYPTSVFARAEILRAAFKTLIDDASLNYVMPVVRYPAPVQRAFTLEEGRAKMLQPDQFYSRSQDLPPAYFDPGQFYIGRKTAWMENAVIYSERTYGMVLPSESVQDIDTLDDWQLAERKFAQAELHRAVRR